MTDDTVTPGAPVPTPYPYPDSPAFPANVGLQPDGMPLHACMGLNSCKASDRFGRAPDRALREAHRAHKEAPKSHNDAHRSHKDAHRSHKASTPPPQPNDCAGQGYCATAVNHTCHVQNSCKNQGGCGLYGTGEEMNQPGTNACKSLGSCATPINAERFSTNGPNQGKSVWVRAREVFETQVWPSLRQELEAKRASGEIPPGQPLPEKLGPPPAPFAQTGPTYLWISDDNTERGNMTSCGASGMSGAGGCS